jgi:flagellin
MAAILSTNMASLYAQKNLSTAQASLSDSVQRLSSGTRINSAKDDAAGYGISESMRGVKNVVDQNIRNAQNAISWTQTAEAALDVVGKMLQRALTLTTQKQDATLNDDQTDSINDELQAIAAQIDSIEQRTKFQGGTGSASVFGEANDIDVETGGNTPLTITAVMVDSSSIYNPTGSVTTLDLATIVGDEYAPGIFRNVATSTDGVGAGATINFGVDSDGAVTFIEIANSGSGYAVGDTLSLLVETTDGGTPLAVDIDTAAVATTYGDLQDIQDLIAENATNRGTLGAAINSLEYAVDNMQTLSTNLADGISRIVDTDYAAETSNLTRTQILQQAATSMLAQANQMPNVILTLLK